MTPSIPLCHTNECGPPPTRHRVPALSNGVAAGSYARNAGIFPIGSPRGGGFRPASAGVGSMKGWNGAAPGLRGRDTSRHSSRPAQFFQQVGGYIPDTAPVPGGCISRSPSRRNCRCRFRGAALFFRRSLGRPCKFFRGERHVPSSFVSALHQGGGLRSEKLPQSV